MTESGDPPQAVEPVGPVGPLQLSFEVGCGASHAFATWTAHLDRWWPSGHTVSASPDTRVTLEPELGGRIYERTAAGDEHDWGEITAWEPPRRLAYLWHLRRDRADATDVEITFTPLDSETTRVDVVHTGWERLGADAGIWRDRNQAGWGGLLPHFVAACRPATRRQA